MRRRAAAAAGCQHLAAQVVFTAHDEQAASLLDELPRAILGLGGELVALKNSMPLPPSFGEILDSEARRVQYRKLALWSHTEFAKIIALDADVFAARRIDETPRFRPTPSAPILCSYGCDRRVAGFNSGVMVRSVGRTERRAGALRPAPRVDGGHGRGARARHRGRRRRHAAFTLPAEREDAYSGGAAASAAYRRRCTAHFAARRRRSVLLGRVVCRRSAGRGRGRSDARAGHDWTWRSVRDESLCKRTPPKAGGGSCGGALNIMSRRYNERPGHCDRCDPSYEPSISLAARAQAVPPRSLVAARRGERVGGAEAVAALRGARGRGLPRPDGLLEPHRAPRPEMARLAATFAVGG